MCQRVNKNCECTDYMLPKYDYCHPVTYHNVSICKLRRLLDEPMSADCYEQQVFYLYDYLKFCQNGFYLSDLLHLSRVIEILAEKIETHEIYRPYFKKLLDIAAFPPIKHNHGEELSQLQNLSEYLSVLGFLGIWLNDLNLKYRTYNSLLNLLTAESTKVSILKLETRYKAVELSHLPEIITQLLDLAINAEYFDILNIAVELTKMSPQICEKMVKFNAIDYLLLRLLPETDEDYIGQDIAEIKTYSETDLQIINLTCQILINLVSNIRHLDDETLKQCTPSLNSIWSMRYIFRGLLYSKYCQLGRNNFMAFIMLCLETFPYVQISECHLLDDLAVLSVATEIETDLWVKDLHFTNSESDIFFKKMLVLSLTYCRKYPHFTLIYEIRDVVPGLIKIISIEYENDWHSEEQETLIQYTLISLYYVSPKLIKSFVENDGIQNLLIIIETYMFFIDDCNKYKLLLSLKIITKLLSMKDSSVIESLRFNSGVSVLNMLVRSILTEKVIHSYDQEILTYVFHILGFLYEEPIIKDPSLNHLIKYFSRITKPNYADTCANPQTLISALYFLWILLEVSDRNLVSFIKKEGIYLLLDVIDTKCFPVKVIGLGCLVDICENPFCVPFLLTWRGGENRKIIFSSLLAQIFGEECKKIKVQLNDNNIITDIYYPLMGETQYTQVLKPERDCHSCTSIADMLGSARPKIYALLQLLNIRYKSNVKLVNEHYKISYLPIPKKDKVMLHLAQNYFALKLSEGWAELIQDLIHCNVEPTEIDGEMLTVLSDQMQNWNQCIKKQQETILKSETHKEKNKELEFYDAFRKCRLQDAIDALRQMRLIATTTDIMFRSAYKEKQQKEINNYLAEFTGDELIRTYNENLNVTYITPQHIKAEGES